ncbi:dihydropteroate synthase [Alteromonas sp. CYL-A6]|uniref:dihydropteroate synthase n=1 Tax=Alteromonas nitratireducens TaxID=3390813 RepID=UPI0034BEE89B
MNFRNKQLDLSAPAVMGILNVTPDSFSDGGRHQALDAALCHARDMVAAGAAFIDVGGESTRPGASAVTEQQELDRVIPVIEHIAKELDTVISIDTSKAGVMKEAVKAGARLINDVRALREPGALETAAALDVPVCLMHMQGQPRTMQQSPTYDDVVRDVSTFLTERATACMQAGIASDDIMLDPGFGFGKTLAHNYQLLNALEGIIDLGYPVLVGMSRKSMIGQLLDRSTDERLAGSIALATIAAQKGAHIIRVHDVRETADAVAIVNYLTTLQA